MQQKGTGAEDLGPFKDATHFSRGKDEDYESKSGSDHMEGGSCDEQDQDQPSRKKRYHRHTAKQIQEMEMVFKECPHPDEKQRLELSRELGLEPRQVKFWFQNRRTQLKAQHEKVENSVLRAENDKLRAENITMREALKTACCQNCGGQISLGDLSFIEQQLRLENARLRDELDRITALASNYLARTTNPIVSAPQQVSISPPDLSVRAGSFASSLPSEAISNRDHISEADKPLMAELAIVAMEEFFAVTQADESLWTSQRSRDTMNYDEYTAHFSRGMGPRHVGLKTEATRATGLVMMNTASLVEIIMDHTKWTEMFTCIVSKALALQVLSNGPTSGSWNNALQLMYAELQMPSPIVPTRQVYFLRYCKQHSEGLWAIVDVSLDGFREKPLFPVTKCRRRPSGFLVQEMPNGYSKVTIVEHTEYEEREIHPMFRQMVAAGLAFGAQRWLAILQRQCERLSTAMATNLSTRDLGVISSANGGRSMLKLAQRMTDSFCGGISASTSHTWTTLSGTGEEDVRVMTRKSINNPGEPHGIVLSAATSLWLRVAPRRLFDFLRDEHNRSEWDILSNGGVAQEISHISNGQSPGNNVALLKVNAMNTSQNNMLILQESCWDSSGSLVVYAPVDIPAMNLVIQGGDPGYVALLPSGFAILPDGLSSSPSHLDDSVPSRGCLLTVAFQILVSNVPTAKLNLESVTTVNRLISCTVQRIKSALGCEDV